MNTFSFTSFAPKQVIVIENKIKIVNGIVEEWEEETIFKSDTMPMCIGFAERWAKLNGKKLIKSPKKIAEIYPMCHRTAVSENEKIFYVKEKNKS